MNWIKFSFVFLAALIRTLSGSHRPARHPDVFSKPAEDPPASPEKPDEVRESDDLSSVVAPYDLPANPADRHTQLVEMITRCYQKRHQPDSRQQLYQAGQVYQNELSDFMKGVDAETISSGGVLKYLAIALAEDERYSEAIAVCEAALDAGIEDGTKTGFQGRIDRLRKKQFSS